MLQAAVGHWHTACVHCTPYQQPQARYVAELVLPVPLVAVDPAAAAPSLSTPGLAGTGEVACTKQRAEEAHA
jgi:hypothetical protein